MLASNSPNPTESAFYFIIAKTETQTGCPAVGQLVNVAHLDNGIQTTNHKGGGINLWAYNAMKEANGQRLCPVWLQLCSIPKKAKLWRQIEYWTLSGIKKSKGWKGKIQKICRTMETFWYYNIMIHTHHCMLVQSHRIHGTKNEVQWNYGFEY